jgi:hypothetical protein
MAGLFRRFRRNKVEEAEPEPEPSSELEGSEEGVVPEDGFVATEGVEGDGDPAYDPDAVGPYPDTSEAPAVELPAADEPTFEPELAPAASSGDLEVGAPAPADTAAAISETSPAEAVGPVAPLLPPSSTSGLPVPTSGLAAAPPAASAGPRLPAPGSVPAHDMLSLPAPINCFLCGHRLETNGYCPSCQMSWVE